jgi:hypothetical protein
MRLVKVNVTPEEIQKAIKGEKFIGRPSGTGFSHTFEMDIDFSEIVDIKCHDTFGSPEGVICQIKKYTTYDHSQEYTVYSDNPTLHEEKI